MKQYASGLLCHITSLPSRFGIGDFGPEAYRFADLLSTCGQKYWQILPLAPTRTACGNSPYTSPSAFAGNTLLISPELLYEEDLIDKSDCDAHIVPAMDAVDYDNVVQKKERFFGRAVKRFQHKKRTSGKSYQQFCKKNKHWLDDYALFESLHDHFTGKAWNRWPAEIRDRKESALAACREKFKHAIEKHKILQYLFFRQWGKVKSYCNGKGIRIIGDIPLYVDYYSSDVWSHQELFQLDSNGKPVEVAGVPPDYFSETGQYWGNPVYNWKAIKRSGYRWWRDRIAQNLLLFDELRLDHFRGFAAYWSIPAEETKAVNGAWRKGPGAEFFSRLKKELHSPVLIAEDLGDITEDVLELRDSFDLPGMRILQFGLEALGDDAYHLHESYPENCIAYTGTHDNNTLCGWFKEQPAAEQKKILEYLGAGKGMHEAFHWRCIQLLMKSPARTVIIPLQDVLGLDERSRMNRPSVAQGNWRWRLLPVQLSSDHFDKLEQITRNTRTASSQKAESGSDLAHTAGSQPGSYSRFQNDAASESLSM